MAETHWLIYITATKEVLAADFITNGQHPKDAGFAWNPAMHTAKQLSSAPNVESDLLETATMTYAPNLPFHRARAIARVKAAAELAKIQSLSGGEGKKLEYAMKKQEVLSFRADPADLDPSTFPFTSAALAAAGVSRSDPDYAEKFAETIGRFEAGQTASLPEVAKFAALEENAVLAIRAADNVSAINAAAVVTFA